MVHILIHITDQGKPNVSIINKFCNVNLIATHCELLYHELHMEGKTWVPLLWH